MTHLCLDDARRLFERSEGEADPARKIAALEEALEVVDVVLHDSRLRQLDRDLATNLRRSNIRRLLSQLVAMRDIQMKDWYKYIELLLTRREADIKAVLEEDASLNESYEAFFSIWKHELLEALRHAQGNHLDAPWR